MITGYRATVAPAALGLGVTALIGLQLSDAADHEEVARRLRDLEEIEDCWFIAGDDSYMLKVRVGDVDGLEHTIRRLSGTKGVATHPHHDRALHQVGEPGRELPETV